MTAATAPAQTARRRGGPRLVQGLETSGASAATVEALGARTLGERIRALRVARGLSQADLGGDRLSKGFISHVESGRSRLSPESLAYIAGRLGVQIAALTPELHDSGADVLLRAAEAALRAEAPDDADALLLDLPSRLTTATQLAEFHRLRGEIRVLRGDLDGAVDEGQAALRALPAGDASEVCVRAHNLVGKAHLFAGRLVAALQYFDRAAELAGRGIATPATRALVHRNRGTTHMRLADPLRAVEAYSAARDAAEDAEDLRQLAVAHMGLGEAARQRGEAVESIAHAERAIVLFERLELRRLGVQLLHNIGHAHGDAGDLTQARAYQERALTAARAIGDEYTAGYALERLAAIALAEGDDAAAAAAAAEAAELARRAGDVGLEALAVTGQAEASLATDAVAAAALLARARELTARSSAMERRQVLLRAGSLLRRAGDHAGASAAFEEAALTATS